MNIFEFKSRDYYGEPVNCILKFYKLYKRDLYYMNFEEIEYQHFVGKEYVGREPIKYNQLLDQGLGYSRLSKFLQFHDCDEIFQCLKTQFKHEIIKKRRIYFPESELDKIIEWLESVKVMNKLMEV